MNNKDTVQERLLFLQNSLEGASLNETMAIYEEAFSVLNRSLRTVRVKRRRYKTLVLGPDKCPVLDEKGCPLLQDFYHKDK